MLYIVGIYQTYLILTELCYRLNLLASNFFRMGSVVSRSMEDGLTKNREFVKDLNTIMVCFLSLALYQFSAGFFKKYLPIFLLWTIGGKAVALSKSNARAFNGNANCQGSRTFELVDSFLCHRCNITFYVVSVSNTRWKLLWYIIAFLIK